MHRILALLTVALALAAVQARGEQRSLTLAEVPRLRCITPVLHLIAGDTSGYLYAWTSNDGKAWKEVFRADAWSARMRTETAAGGKPSLDVYVLLTGYPSHVRVGTTGYYTGPVSVDAVEVILPDGSARRPTAAAGVNRASSPENALAADGKCAVLSHTVGANETERAQVDAVELAFLPGKPGETYRLELPKVPVTPPSFGVYTNVAGDSDPHNVPLGWAYRPSARDIAFYDFSIPQSNNPALFAEIRKLNPKHRILLRVFYGTGEVLDYCYDEGFRAKLAASVVKQFSPNVDDFHGIVLSEEELQHAMSGWYAEQPQAWALKYRDRFEQETGKEFRWHSPELRAWLTEKCVFLYNDLYDQAKRAAPKLKVMPFLYVPGDISGWGWIDPAKLKKDGWVYQWFDPPGERSLAVPCRHANPAIREVWTRDWWFNLAIQQLRAAGVPEDELYVQIWSYLPGQDPVAQTENVRKAGVRHLFNFYYAAWIPPEPVRVPNPRDLCMRIGANAVLPADPVYAPLGHGLAQSFRAAAETLAQVRVILGAVQPGAKVQVTLEADESGRPAAKAITTATVEVPAQKGPVALPLKAPLTPGATYWICLKPVEGSSGVLVAVSDNNPIPEGEAIPFEVHGTYFQGWRTYDGDAIRFEGRSAWRVSWEERLAWEAYIRRVR